MAEQASLDVDDQKEGGTNQINPLNAVKNNNLRLSGSVYIFAQHSGKALDVPGGSKKQAAHLIQWRFHGGQNQTFYLHPTNDGYFMIECLCSGLFLDIEGGSMNDGAKIIQWAKHGGNNQQFRIDAVGNGLYRIVAKHSTKALDVNGGSMNDDAVLIQHGFHGGNNQLFRILSSP
mmetsp:Transcript_10187/g.15444  ORF Transcript_10187/g.15444 Transcript_10187/m.15444 type:complete len:175 (-) Transcript_10187:152-676(-)